MALTASRNLSTRATHLQRRGSGPILTGAKIYKGAFLAWTTAGKLTVAANAATLNSAGIADREYDIGTNGEYAEFSFGHEVLAPVAASVTQGLMSDTLLFCADDETVTTATTLGPEIGVLMQPPSGGFAWIGVRNHKTTTQT